MTIELDNFSPKIDFFGFALFINGLPKRRSAVLIARVRNASAKNKRQRLRITGIQ